MFAKNAWAHANPVLDRSPKTVMTSLRTGARLLFPTDLTSFLELIRQHGDTVYSLMFAYAASHSLLLTLFAGYASHSGALSFGALITVCWIGSFTGDVIRFWIGRRYGTRWLGSSSSGSTRGADRGPVWPTVTTSG